MKLNNLKVSCDHNYSKERCDHCKFYPFCSIIEAQQKEIEEQKYELCEFKYGKYCRDYYISKTRLLEVENQNQKEEIAELRTQVLRMRDVALMISKYADPLRLDKVHFAEYDQLCEEVKIQISFYLNIITLPT